MKREKITQPPAFSERAVESIGSLPSLVVHTILFVVAFALPSLGIITWDRMLLVLTTVVSLEAIYLAIFIQIAVNRNTASLREVEEDVDDIQEDLEELGEDIEEISEDIDEIQEDVEGISEDIDEIQEDVEEMSDEEKGELREKTAAEKVKRDVKNEADVLDKLARDVARVLVDLEALKKGSK